MENYIWLIRSSIIYGSFMVLLLILGMKPAQAQKPNIVLLYIDDLGWKDVEYNASPYAKTPNIDKLAAEGMVFTNAYANAPNCAPSRACMLSGQYTPRHGVFTVDNSDQGKAKDRRLIPVPNPTDFIPDESYTIAEALKNVGYTSASIGKWHIGKDPTSQGFQVNIAGKGVGNPGNDGYFSPYNDMPNLPNGPTGEYLTDRLTDEALKFINKNKNNPFFLYLTHYAVHTPIQSKPAKTDKFKKLYPQLSEKWAKYLGMIESVDESVGRVIQKLRQLNLEDNTIVIFYSDNGAHPAQTSLAPLRGTKGMLYEGGIRVPFIWKWPGTVAPGSTCKVSIIGTDLYPTFMEITGAQVPPGYDLDGESLMPLLTQTGGLQRQAIHWHSPIYLRKAYNEIYERFRTTPSSAMIKGPWKLIEFFETGDIELYNIKDDISESKELAEFLPDTVDMLYEMLEQWRQETKAPMCPKKNPQFVRLFKYQELPSPGQVIDPGTNDSMIVKVSGTCMSNEIDSIILRIYHRATLYKEHIQKLKFSNGQAKFSFQPKCIPSEHFYKFKVYFIRNVITEIDTIVNKIKVKPPTNIADPINLTNIKSPQISIRVYPSQKSITLSLPSRDLNGIDWYLYDLKGRVLFSKSLKPKTSLNETIDLSKNGLGISFLTIKQGSNVQTIPIVLNGKIPYSRILPNQGEN